MLDIIQNWLIEPKNWIPSPLTTLIALLALTVAYRNYQRKSGVDIAGTFDWGIDVRADQPYVKELRLENRKDRAITIYYVFLKLGKNIYVQLQNHEESPLILKAFETYKVELDLPSGYSKREGYANISEALLNGSVKKKIILSTGSGRYIVKRKIRHWHIKDARYKIPEITLVKPQILHYKGVLIGNRTKYIVEFYDPKAEAPTSIIGFPQPVSESIGGLSYLIAPADLESVERLTEFLSRCKAMGCLGTSTEFKIIQNSHYSKPEKGVSGNVILAQGTVTFWQAVCRGTIKRLMKK